MPIPRWLCVATGTASNTRAISSSLKPSSVSRSCERSITSSCAHGQAVMPWASTPTRRRVPRADETAEPNSLYISWVGVPDAGAGLCSG